MAVAPKHPKRSPAQVKASQKFAAAGRSAQARTRAAAIAKTGKPPPRTAKQKAATKNFAASGRAAQAARRAGKQPAPKKKAAAPDIRPRCGVSTQGALSLHELPACGPVALAEHLAAFTGITASDEEVLALHERAGVVTLANLFEAAADGFAGTRLAWFERCDPGTVAPGLVYGVQLPAGYHAVLSHPAGMLTWGRLMPWYGTPEEAWWLEWEAE